MTSAHKNDSKNIKKINLKQNSFFLNSEMAVQSQRQIFSKKEKKMLTREKNKRMLRRKKGESFLFATTQHKK